MDFEKMTVAEYQKQYGIKLFTSEGAIKSPDSVYTALDSLNLATSPVECFGALALDVANKVIATDIIFKGTANKSLVHPRDIFSFAIKHNAVSIIVFHNHPTGNPDASEADYACTEKLVEGGKILGIPVIDSMIITKAGNVSLRELRGSIF